MSEFHLQCVTTDGMMYDGNPEMIVVRTVCGDVGILKGHSDYVTVIDDGSVRITENGNVRMAHCKSGVLSMFNNEARIVANEFVFEE